MKQVGLGQLGQSDPPKEDGELLLPSGDVMAELVDDGLVDGHIRLHVQVVRRQKVAQVRRRHLKKGRTLLTRTRTLRYGVERLGQMNQGSLRLADLIPLKLL